MYVALKQIGKGGEYCVTPARAAAKETPILSLDTSFVPNFWGVPVFLYSGTAPRLPWTVNIAYGIFSRFLIGVNPKEKGKKAWPVEGSFLVSSRNAPPHGSVTLLTMTCMIITRSSWFSNTTHIKAVMLVEIQNNFPYKRVSFLVAKGYRFVLVTNMAAATLVTNRQ